MTAPDEVGSNLLSETAPPSGASHDALIGWLCRVVMPSLPGRSARVFRSVRADLERRLRNDYGLDDPASFLSYLRFPEAGPAGVRSEVSTPSDWEEIKAVSLSELYAHPDLAKPRQWDLEPYTARGRTTLLTTAPKVGKSTFAGLYAHAKAMGGTFIGQTLSQGSVLIVAPDESWRDLARRHRALGTPGDSVAVWVARGPTLREIAKKAAEVRARLIIVDTLSRVARIPDENDNSAWVRWWGNADPDIRESDAAWLFVHHDRKSGGKDGVGIRGASAIFGSVDVALSLHRVDGEPTRRVLRVEGTRFDQAEALVIELDAEAGTYRAVGEVRIVSALSDKRLMAVHSALRNEPARVSEIEIRLEEQGAEVPHATLYGYLDNLVTVGLARKEGSGGQRDPSRYAHVDPPGARGTDNPTSPVVGQSETCPRQADKDSQPVDEHEDTLSEENGPKTGENLSACQDPYRPTTDKLSTADADRLAADLDAHLDRARAEEAR